MNTLLRAAEAHPAWSAFALVATGVFVATLQKVPTLIWALFVRVTTIRLEVDGSNPAYPLFEKWLSRHAGAAAASTFVVAAHDDKVGVAPGFGTHLLWQDGRPLIVSRAEKKTSGENYWSDAPQEGITITTIGLKSAGRALIQRLIDTVYGDHRAGKGLAVRVWHFGYWYPLSSRANRPLSSVILSEGLKSEIVGQAEWFFANQQWFVDRGIPYRNGYLFAGPPGTGKSSTVCALGTHYHRPVCMMSLSTMSGDNDLLNAFLQAPANAIVLIEDVDAMNSVAARKEEAGEPKAGESAPAPAPSPTAKEAVKAGVTLSGLLNAIDGVAAPEGRLLILTTNHPEKLDPALIRKARIDRQFFLGPLTPDLVEEMASRFFPGDPEAVAAIRSKADLGPDRPAAEWQDEFMLRARQG